jgi:molybdate transport system ATP-binding protein
MGLSVRIVKAVEGFSLDVQWDIGRELAVLFGYSGAGKSMTLNSIAGLMKPDEGHVSLGSKTCFDSGLNLNLRPQERPFGYVFQDSALMPHMTVRGNILFGAKGMGKDEKHERAREMVKAFHLKGLEDKMPSEISGGQKQRVALARALIGRPGALLLDEPFSALDNPIRVEMRRLLRGVRDEFDIPVVLVTHDIYEANELADRVIIYCDGKVAQSGPPSEVFSRPATQEVATLVNAERLSGRILTPVLQSFS